LVVKPLGRGRVLLLTSNFPRWSGDSTTPFVLHLAQDLQALDWAVTVVAPHAPGAAASEELGGVRVERFRYLWPESAQTVCYQGGAMANLRHAPTNYLKLPALVLRQLSTTARRMFSGGYDLLNSHWILPQGFVGTLAARSLGVPHVATVHGGDIFSLRGRLMTACKTMGLRGADVVTVNSSVTRAAVEAIAPALPDLRTIPMGVTVPRRPAPEAVDAVRARYRRGAGPLAVFVGRLVEEKGVGDLVEAMAEIRRDLPDATAVIAGAGQDQARFEAQVEALGLSNSVHFAGWVQPEEVPTLLAAADVFIGPSKRSRQGWIEGQGLTFLEAMLAGTPVVATASGGIVDAVVDGETGFLVPEAAPGAIATAVKRLAREPGVAASVVARARARVLERFTRDATARAMSAAFEAAVAAREPVRAVRQDRRST
jgi:glycosyltransferase involved in cell wall biosynthesis